MGKVTLLYFYPSPSNFIEENSFALTLHTSREMEEIGVIIRILPNILCHLNSMSEFRIDKSIAIIV